MSWVQFLQDDMAYNKSAKEGPLVAAISALVLGTLVSLGVLYGLNKKFQPDEPAIAAAASLAAKNPSPSRLLPFWPGASPRRGDLP
jgi:hypothetical protein